MKILLTSLLVSMPAFADVSSSLSHDELKDIYKEELKKVTDNSEYVLFFDLCAYSRCKVDVLKKGALVEMFTIRGEKNSNGASKIIVNVFDSNYSYNKIITKVCISNNECKYFDNLRKFQADYAYENNLFLYDPQKTAENIYASMIDRYVVKLDFVLTSQNPFIKWK